MQDLYVRGKKQTKITNIAAGYVYVQKLAYSTT